MTPLAFAAKNGHLPVCELLIGAGADRDHTSKVRILHEYLRTYVIIIKARDNIYVYRMQDG